MATQASGYNPNADPIKLGDGSHSSISAGVYKDADLKNPISSDEKLSTDQQLYGQIKIKFASDERPTLEHPNIAYDLPSNVEVKNQGPFTLYDGTKEAGTWEIKDGVAYLHYNESYLAATVTEAHLKFDFTVKDKNKGDGQKTDIKFPGVSETVTISHRDGDVSGWKGASNYNADEQTYTWTLSVTPKTVANKLVITDTAGSNLSFIKDSFVLVDTSGNPVEGICNVSINGQVATIDLGNVKAGEYRIQYKTKVSEEAIKKLQDGKKLDETQNNMHWTWGTEGENGGSASTAPGDLRYSMVSKSADGSSTADRIKWVVKLNSGSLKADMGGYKFEDTLDSNQRFLGDDFTVSTDADGKNQIMSGATDPTSGKLEFTLPENAGKQELYVTYYTELKDKSSKDKVTNTSKVTPPDADHGPAGEGTGEAGPYDTAHYISKKVLDDSSAATDGVVWWESTIDFKAMTANTDPASIAFEDGFASLPGAVDWDWNKDIVFDADSVSVCNGSTELLKGTDYVIEKPDQWNTNNLKLKFRDTDTVRRLIGSAEAVKVKYKTTIAKVVTGEYINRATVTSNKISKNNTTQASYTIQKTSPVDKASTDATWDPNYAWTDGTKGAWLSSWTVCANRYGQYDHQWKGENDLLGNDMVIEDTLPSQAEFVQGSAKYSLKTDNWHYAANKNGVSIEPVFANGKMTFTVPTAEAAAAQQGKCYVELTYQTATKDPGLKPGESMELENKASAACGDLTFPEGTGTSTIKNAVLQKTGSQKSGDPAVTYTIKVNQNGFDIDPTSDSLKLVDTMDPNCGLVSTSLKVLDADGNALTKGVTYQFENVMTSAGMATRLTLTVPDGKPLTVKYSVIPYGTVNTDVKLKNTCELSGFAAADVVDDQVFHVNSANGGTSQEVYGFKLTKSDEVGTPLKGAVFDLYRVNLDTSSKGDIKAEKVGTETSDANGDVTFGTKDKPLKSETLYYYVESKAPEGYEVTFADRTYVMLKSEGSDNAAYDKAYAKAKELGITPSSKTSLNVYDRKKQEQPADETVSVSVEKKWVGRTADKAQFQLYANDEPVSGKTLTLTADDSWKGSFSDLPKVADDGHEIKYTVKEISVPDGYTSESTQKKDGTWVFTNTYSVSGSVSVDLTASKELVGEGAKLKADEFKFKLEGDADVSGEKVHQIKTNNAEGNVAFDKLTFNEAGTYKYTVSEVVPGDAVNGLKDGVTYDRSTYNVTVTVTDNGKGGLEKAISIEKDGTKASSIEFQNRYQKTKGIGVELSARKTVDGAAPSDAQKFSFDLNKSDESGAKGDWVETVKNEGDKVSFSKLTYTDATDEWYTISEQQPKAKDGFEYDSKTVKVHVVVTKGNDNQLTAAVTYFSGDKELSGPATFKNEVAPVSTKLSVKKLVNGGSVVAANKEFSFSLYEVGDKDEPKGDAIDTVAMKPGETAAFGKGLSFDAAGAYQYVIVETGDLGDGWTKASPVTATVDVVAGEDGTLSVKSVTYSKSDKDSEGNAAALFDNAYAATGSATLAVQKTVNGKAPAADAKFDFELTPLDDAPMPDGAKSLAATTKGGKPASFADLAYTLKDAGKTYRYLIHETSEATEGWTNAGDVIAKVTVGADQGNGKLGAPTVEYVSAADEKASAANADGTAALFDNTYKQTAAEGSFQLSLVKKVNKEAPLTGETFEFSATAEGANADTAPALANVTTDAGGAAAFAVAKLSDKDAGKTYTYRIHEVSNLDGGKGTWTRAADVIATVAVGERSGDGKLAAKVTYCKNAQGEKPYEGAAQFNNTFVPDAVSASVKVKKASVNGSTDVKTDEAYTFGLYKKGQDGQPEGEAIATVSGKLGKELSFASDKLTFDKLGTYEYLVREETHNGSEGWGAVADVPVTATVKAKGGDGPDARDLTATVKYGDSDKAGCASFADTYTATGSATLAVSKVVNGGKDKAEGKTFEFELKDAKGEELSRTIVAAGETEKFAPIEYTLSDAGKTFEYTISEIGHDSGRWFKAGDVIAKVTVGADQGNGQLGAPTVEYVSAADEKASVANTDGTAALFDNTHAAPATAELKVSKTINGSKEDGAKEKFAFELAAEDGVPMPASSELTVDGTGTGSFGEISYSEPGTYRYTICETSYLGAGWKNAKDVTATVTVERNEAAKTLKVTGIAYSNATDDQSAAAFDNTYTVKGTEVSLKAVKVLKGAELKAGQFEFQLKDAEGKVLQTAKNDKDGSVSFDPISYEASDLDGRGTSRDFEYTISEVVPDGAIDGVKDGVTYDATEHKVKVRVSDDGTSGQLEAAVTYDDKSEPPVFTNTYKPKEETPHEDTPKGDTPKDDTPKGGKSSGKTVLDVFGMPATGDNTTLFVTVIATAGLCALASGLRLARRKRD